MHISLNLQKMKNYKRIVSWQIDDSHHGEIVEDEEQAEPLSTSYVDKEMIVVGALHASKEGSQDGLKVIRVMLGMQHFVQHFSQLLT